MDVASETDGRTILIASGNGVLKTENNGETWRLMTDWQITEVLDIAIDPHNPDNVYIATAYGPNRSTDGGGTWELIDAGVDQRYCSVIHIDPDNPAHIYLGGEGGLYRSVNGGESWTIIAAGNKGVRTIAQHPAAGNVILIGTENDGIFRSDDRGETWRQTNNGLRPDPIYTVTFHPHDPDIAFAGGWESGVYKTINGGASWVRHTRGFENTTVMTLAVDPLNPDILFAGMYRGGLYKSSNGGTVWNHAGIGIADVWSITIR